MRQQYSTKYRYMEVVSQGPVIIPLQCWGSGDGTPQARSRGRAPGEGLVAKPLEDEQHKEI